MGGLMGNTFYDQPILNSPYEEPTRHHALNEKGQPTEDEPVIGRRKSDLTTPMVPGTKGKKAEDAGQASLGLGIDDPDDGDE